MHRRKATGWWLVAAYGSSSGLEESAQGGELEERVERHVVICARAGRALVAGGLTVWVAAAAVWPRRLLLVCGVFDEAFAFLGTS